ncbi:MAG: ATP-binding protein [Gammaproteobacteria bacterium]|nr:ATP-binding protein [Gammaproteobacteria bacterium]
MGSDRLRIGSIWRRWDPHIHAPGTLLNDQYNGDDPWEDFLGQLENAAPRIEAVGVTDYYSIDTYQQVIAHKAEGRLPHVGLIFPNIEMRYGIGTDAGSPVNFHLLVSPEDPDHVNQIHRFLSRLTFKLPGETFRCDRADLIRLGKTHDPTINDDALALTTGTNQFKVNVDQLLEMWDASDWIQHNGLIAIAGGSNDGSSGLQADASLAALRQKIERVAHIVFAAQPKQREFWLGRGVLTADQIKQRYRALKPCLHGSDAHKPAQVGQPAKDRFSWVKGDTTFEALRHACMEPESRAFIGAKAPAGALPSQVIQSISVDNAPWFTAPSVPINPGLVGIIGARGSGKTALADMIAAGTFALSEHVSDRSFVKRAEEFLTDARAVVSWQDGDPTHNELKHVDLEDILDTSRVQYLSQQFVDNLCSSDGASEELLAEIERVIFQAHPGDERLGTNSFQELLTAVASLGRQRRRNHEQAIADAGEELSRERDKRDALPRLKASRVASAKTVLNDKRDRKKLLTQGSEARVKEFDRVMTAADAVRGTLEQARRRLEALRLLEADVKDRRDSRAAAQLRRLQETHREAGLDDKTWALFLTDYCGDVTTALNQEIVKVTKLIQTVSGPAEGEPPYAEDAPDLTLLPADTPLTKLTSSLLDAEVKRLGALIGIDQTRQKAFKQLTEKISRMEAAIAKVDRQIASAEEAGKRITELIQIRKDNYVGVFAGVIAEETALADLYAPLAKRLSAESGALSKLSFSIRRNVDVAAWAAAGEALLDLRKAGDFKGRGALLEAATLQLLGPWQAGTAEDVAKAMTEFRAEYDGTLKAAAPVDRKDLKAYRHWAAQVSEWMYSTAHIEISYGIQYEGLEIERLSPGTRGIVLLLLYLAIDNEDDRPLIIDQPEENLDPKSIFDELVTRFRTAKLRRQIIIVTHNANLVVNTDAEQVIVATCGPHRPNELPEITYQAGSLEDPEIRRSVCDILEGGEEAFRERARRLRVHLLPR